MLIRILTSIILIFSILFLPFWLSAILVFAGMAYFSFFWEGVGILFISDLLYGVRETKFYGVIFVSLIVGVIMLAVIEIFKKKLKFYA